MQRFVLQVIALSIILLLVTDFLEQSWLNTNATVKEDEAFKTNIQSYSVPSSTASSNHQHQRLRHQLDKSALQLQDQFFVAQHTHRSLQQDGGYPQNFDASYEHRCGNNEFKNSNLDLGVTDYWQPLNSELSVYIPGIVDGANVHALQISNRSSWFAGTYQVLTRSCFQVGDVMDIQFRIKFKNDNNAVPVPCNPALEDDYAHCPFVILGSNYNLNNEDSSYNYHHERIYDHTMTWNTDGDWNHFHVIYHLTEANAGSAVTSLYAMIVGGQGDMILDNVNVRLLPCYSNVVVNGDAETGLTSPWGPVAEPPSHFQIANANYSSSSSTSAASDGVVIGNYSYVHVQRTDPLSGMRTDMDVDFRHCLAIDSWWRFTAKVRLVNPSTSRSSQETCVLGSHQHFGNCPAMIFVHNQYDEPDAAAKYLNDPVMMESWDPTGWNTFDMKLALQEDVLGPDKYQPSLWIIGGHNQDDFYVDDVQFYRLESWETPTAAPTSTLVPTVMPTTHCTRNWAAYGSPIWQHDWQFNDDAALTSTMNQYQVYWWSSFGSYIGLETPGYGDTGNAVRLSDRGSWAHGMFFFHVDIDCVDTTSTWRVSFQTKLYFEESGLPVTTCDPISKSLDCPMVRMMLRYSDGPPRWLTLHDTDMIWPSDGSYTSLNIEFNLPEEYYSPTLTHFAPVLVGGPSGSVLVIDDLVFQRLTPEETPTSTPTQTLTPTVSPTIYCTKNSIRNGDLSLGSTDHWHFWGSKLSLYEPGYGTERYAIQVTDRTGYWGGLSQRIDPICFEENSVWRIQFQAKLLNATTGEPMTTCNPIDDSYLNTDCPMMKFVLRKNYGAYHQVEIRDADMVWNTNGDWSKFDVIWAPTGDVISNDLTYAMAVFFGGNKDANLLLDDVSVERLEHWEIPTSSPTDSPMPSFEPTTYCESDQTKNPDGEIGTADGWIGWGVPTSVNQPGYGGSNHSLIVYDRTSWHHGIGQWFDPFCVRTSGTSEVNATTFWRLTAKVRLYDQATGNPITREQCNPKNILSNWCPMGRIVTGQPYENLNDENDNHDRRHRHRHRHLSTHHNFTTTTYRDTDMVWNDVGDWVDLNLYMQFTPEMTAAEVNHFFPMIAGGPPGSVLEVDDVSIQRTDGTDADETHTYRLPLPPAKTCSSLGDPHLVTFDGVAYDNHQLGWQTLFQSHGIVIEVEQVHIKNVPMAFNRAWRAYQDGVLLGEGSNGVVPEGGVLHFFEPILLWVQFVVEDVSEHRVFQGEHMYNIYITASEFDASLQSQCNPIVVEDETPELNADQATIEEAQAMCANVTEMYKTTMYDACVKDVLILSEVELNATNVTNVTVTDVINTHVTSDVSNNLPLLEMYSHVLSMEMAIDLMIAQTDQPEDGTSEEDEQALAEQIQTETDPLTLEAETLRTAQVANETAEDLGAGVEGDPVILGIQKQAFDFEGTSNTWYANFASRELQWNMKYHHFDSCTGENGMYVTSMGYTIQREREQQDEESPVALEHELKEPHQVLVSINDESQVFPGCDVPGEPCLSDGSLQINVDGVTITKPGDYFISNDLRIIAFNTWEACARKWHDFDEGIHKHDDLLNNKAVHRNRKLRNGSGGSSKSSSSSSSRPSFWDSLLRRPRALLSSKTALEFIRDDRPHMVKPLECSPWLETRTIRNDLFVQNGGWSNVYIETRDARFQVQHRQVQKTREELQGGDSGLAEDIVVEGMLFEGTQHTCEAHVLDGWLAHTTQSLKEERWEGILGETQVLKYNAGGSPITTNRWAILVGADEDYEVSHAFDTEFAAKIMNDQIQRALQQRQTLTRTADE